MLATMRYVTLSDPVTQSGLLDSIAWFPSSLVTRFSVTSVLETFGQLFGRDLGRRGNIGGEEGLVKNTTVPLESTFALYVRDPSFPSWFVPCSHGFVDVRHVRLSRGSFPVGQLCLADGHFASVG